MIVACPSCETKYNLPDGKVTAKGLKVKCAKCEHVFRVTPPQPEEDVEVLTDETAEAPKPEPRPAPKPAPEPEPESDFDKAFEEAVADGGDELGDDADSAFDEDFGSAPKAGGGASESVFEDEDSDDLFAGFADDEPEKDDSGGFDGFDLDEDDDKGGQGESLGDDLGLDDDFGLADENLEGDDADPGLIADETEEEDYDDEARSDLFQSLSGDDLDLEPKRKGGGFGKFLLYLILLLLLVGGGAVATYNFGLWSLPESLQDKGVKLGFDLPFKVPFVLGPDEPAKTEPGELPAERIKNIQPVDFRQYVITNEHAGPLFVVEGKALNKFKEAKERIKVLVTLFDEQGKVLATQEQMCGNTLSLLQLQVQTKEEIEESLNSSAGIYANNSFIKPDQTTPFMVVFFDPPKNVKEYQIEIVDARDPKR